MPRSVSPLPDSADVVILGGGVIGTSAAFHLAEAGVDVALVERAQLGSGSTCRAAGGVRTQFSDALNVEIAKRSLDAYRNFGRRPGWEIDLKQVGYLFVLSRRSDVEKFERSVALQNEYGLASRMLTAGEARELCPLVQGDDILAGAFSPGDGLATPEGVVQGYAFAARAHGAEIRVNCEVLDINTSGDEITEVVTDHGSIRTSTVICAAGAWSRSRGAMVGLDLPVTPLRRQILFTEAMDGLPAQIPMTIDFESSFYFHREGPGLLFGTSDVCHTQDEWLERAEPVLRRRAPLLLDAPIAGGWWGDYEMTPDHNALIGEARGGPGRFLYATGFSGHGFQQAPGVGEIVRDLYLGREPFVDVSALAAGRPERRERNVV